MGVSRIFAYFHTDFLGKYRIVTYSHHFRISLEVGGDLRGGVIWKLHLFASNHITPPVAQGATSTVSYMEITLNRLKPYKTSSAVARAKVKVYMEIALNCLKPYNSIGHIRSDHKKRLLHYGSNRRKNCISANMPNPHITCPKCKLYPVKWTLGILGIPVM